MATTQGRPWFRADLGGVLLGVCFGGFALWTVAFLVGLAFGVGWALALPLWLALLCIAAVPAVGVLRGCTGAVDLQTWTRCVRGSGASWCVFAGTMLVVAFAEDHGDPLVPVVLIAGAALVWIVYELRTVQPSMLTAASVVPLGAAVLFAVLGASSWPTTIAGVVGLVVLAGAGSRLGLLPAPAAAGSTQTSTPDQGWVLTAPVVAFGLMLAGYLATTRFLGTDNGYYMSKAGNYAARSSTFGIRDYMFGVAGVDHYPRGTILSAFEPFAGMISGVTGLHHTPVVTIALAPLLGFLLPIAYSWSASAFGARRPDLAGTAAAATVFLVTSGHDFLFLARFDEGKSAGALICVPLAAAAVIRAIESGKARHQLLAMAATVAGLGLSPTVGMGMMPAAAAALVAGWWAVPRARITMQRLALSSAPLVTSVLWTALGTYVHRRSSRASDRFPSGFEAWLTRLVGRDLAPDLAGDRWLVALLLGSVALGVLASRRVSQRVYFGLTLAALVLLVYGPLTFPIITDLGYNPLSWRIAWALPVALAVGLAIDLLLDRSWQRAWSPLGGVAIFALFAIGASPLVGFQQGMPGWDFPKPVLQAVERIAVVTPPGGTYLGPPTVEVATVATQQGIYPVAVREYFIRGLLEYPELPKAFHGQSRLALANATTGLEVPVRRIRRALRILDVHTVCLDDEAASNLVTVVEQRYERRREMMACTLYVRRDPTR